MHGASTLLVNLQWFIRETLNLLENISAAFALVLVNRHTVRPSFVMEFLVRSVDPKRIMGRPEIRYRLNLSTIHNFDGLLQQ